MKLESTTEEIINTFMGGFFPAPYTFTDQQIEAIENIAGVDAQDTFADTPMEQALIREYRLNIGRGENAWPAFAEVLREERELHFSRFTDTTRENNVSWLKEAIANCLVVGISPEEIIEQTKIECGIPC